MPIYMTENGSLLIIQKKENPTYRSEQELFVFSRKHQGWKSIPLQPDTREGGMGTIGKQIYQFKSTKYPLLDTIKFPNPDESQGYIDTHNGHRICFAELNKLGLSPDYFGAVSEDNLFSIQTLMNDENTEKRAEAAKAVRQITNTAQLGAAANRLERSAMGLASSRTQQDVKAHLLETLEQLSDAVHTEAAAETVSDRLDGKLKALLDLAQKESNRVNSYFKKGGKTKAKAINAAIELVKRRAVTIPDSIREQSYVQLARECGLYKALKGHRRTQKASSTKKTRAQIAVEALVPELSYKL